MRAGWRLALAGLPGAAVTLAALAAWVPTSGDIPSYFVPLRQRTAEVLRGERGPFWDPDVGCGEPYYANPQTTLLYPLAWLGLVAPAPVAVGIEAGLHLALLGVGCALLARRLGAGGWLEVGAAWSVVMAGPVLDSVRVLNNADALAWMPWVWWAALGGSVPAVASFLALVYLAAEPQLALVTGVVALTLAPRRRTLAAAVLALGLVAVQAMPFAVWVRHGDRGPHQEAQEGLAGVTMPAELLTALAPGAPLPPRIGARFVAHLALPLWAVVLGAIAAFDRRREVRHLAWWGWGLSLLATLPWLPGGLVAWNAVTGGLVRYSGRLLFPAVVALVPAAAAAVGSRRPRIWLCAALAAAAAAGGLALRGRPLPTVVGAVTAGAALAEPLAAPAMLAGVAAVAWQADDALRISPVRDGPHVVCLQAQLSAGRVYVVAPSWQQFRWIDRNPAIGLDSLGLGYTALLDGRRMVRTFAPLGSRALTAQLDEADKGPEGRWWLDALAARRVVAQHPVAGFTELCCRDGLAVYDNPLAWPEASIVRVLPSPGEKPVACGRVRALEGDDDRRAWLAQVDTGGGVFLWLESPDPGWDLRVDGRPAREVAGVGILHGVAVPAGDHRITARYRPPGLIAGAVISLGSLGVLAGIAWRRS